MMSRGLRFIEYGADVESDLRDLREDQLAGRRLFNHETNVRPDCEVSRAELNAFITEVLRRSATGEMFNVANRWHDVEPGVAVLSFAAYDDTNARKIHTNG